MEDSSSAPPALPPSFPSSHRLKETRTLAKSIHSKKRYVEQKHYAMRQTRRRPLSKETLSECEYGMFKRIMKFSS